MKPCKLSKMLKKLTAVINLAQQKREWEIFIKVYFVPMKDKWDISSGSRTQIQTLPRLFLLRYCDLPLRPDTVL